MLRIRVTTAEAVIQETETITAGRRGLECSITFDSAWDGLAKTVVVSGVVKRDIALTGDSIVVPGECVTKENFPLRIGVYGATGDGTIAIPTVWASFGKILPSAKRSEIPPDELTPDLVTQIQQNAANALYLAQNVQQKADSGAFDGEDGFSPVVSTQSIVGGHRVTIVDENGSHNFDVMDGEDGQDATVDATLSQSGEAADALITGRELTALTPVTDASAFSWSLGKTINDSGATKTNAAQAKSTSIAAPTGTRIQNRCVASIDVSGTAWPTILYVHEYNGSTWLRRTYIDPGVGMTVGANTTHVLFTYGLSASSGLTMTQTILDNDFGVRVIKPAATEAALEELSAKHSALDTKVKELEFPADLELPICAAHRGIASSGKVENTMPAYEDAVNKGWRYLETDIRKTSDGVWVLLHDSTIASGVYISNITYAQALTYDLGGGTHIATLEELLILCRRAHVYPVIEVKDSSISQSDADSVWELVEKYEMENECIWLCSSLGGVSKFLTKNPYAPAICTSSSTWTYIDPDTFPTLSAPYAASYKTGKNKAICQKAHTNFSTEALVDNFVEFCHYFGLLAGVYGPTTQAALDALGDRLDMVTSENYRYEIERSYGGGGGSVTIDDTLSIAGAAADAKAAGDAIAAKYSKPSGGIPKTDLASEVQTSLDKADTALQQHQSLSGYATEQWVQQQGYLTQHQSLAAYRTSAAQDVIDAGKADKVTEVTISTAGAVSQALDAGKIYHFTGALTSLTITLNAAGTGQLAQYHFDFDSGSTPPTVTLPGTVTMQGGTFTPEASKHYEVDVLNGYGVSMAW